ncbi:MAG: hypothetical protein AB7D40_09895 [Bacteroidales bacterium]
MKRKLLVLAFFCALGLNGFGQTVVDLGWDWNGSAVAPVSNTYIEGLTHNSTGASFTVNPGTNNELLVTCTGSYVTYKYWAGDLYAADQTYGCLQIAWLKYTDFIEVSLSASSSIKNISAAKLNGTSSDIANGTNFHVLYSDAAPFDVSRVIAYQSGLSFPAARNGGAGISLTLPSGCKSFRIYRKVLIEQTSVNPVMYTVDEFGSTVLTDVVENEKYHTRIGYFSVTLENATTTSINPISNKEKTVVETKYFDVTGREVSNSYKGLVIVKTTYADGTSDVQKSQLK